MSPCRILLTSFHESSLSLQEKEAERLPEGEGIPSLGTVPQEQAKLPQKRDMSLPPPARSKEETRKIRPPHPRGEGSWVSDVHEKAPHSQPDELRGGLRGNLATAEAASNRTGWSEM